MSTKAKAGSGPTPGRVMSRCAAGNLPASSSTRLLSSAILGLMRSSNSADHLVADSHRALAPHFPVASFLLPATVLSYGGCPHSKPRLATDSSIAYASAPCGADARATDPDPGSPNSPPRSAENDSPASVPAAAVRPVDPSSVSAPVGYQFSLHLRSTTRTPVPRTGAQTSVPARWPPCLLEPPPLVLAEHHKTVPLPADVPVCVLAARPFPYPHRRFVESPDGSHNRSSTCSAPLSRALLGWHHQSLLGRRSRHWHGINYTH